MKDKQKPGHIALTLFPAGYYRRKGGSFHASGMEASFNLTDVPLDPPRTPPVYHSGRGRKPGREIPPPLLVAHVSYLVGTKRTKDWAFHEVAKVTGYAPSTVKHIYYLTLRQERPFFSPGLVEVVDFPADLEGFTRRLAEAVTQGFLYPPERVKEWVGERYGKHHVEEVMGLYLANLEEFSTALPHRLSGTVLAEARTTIEAFIAKARLIAQGKD